MALAKVGKSAGEASAQEDDLTVPCEFGRGRTGWVVDFVSERAEDRVTRRATATGLVL